MGTASMRGPVNHRAKVVLAALSLRAVLWFMLVLYPMTCPLCQSPER
jgi:hypothetical protein